MSLELILLIWLRHDLLHLTMFLPICSAKTIAFSTCRNLMSRFSRCSLDLISTVMYCGSLEVADCPLRTEVVKQSEDNIVGCVELLLYVWLTGLELKRRDAVQKLGMLSRCDLLVNFLQRFLSCDPLKVSKCDDCLMITMYNRRHDTDLTLQGSTQRYGQVN